MYIIKSISGNNIAGGDYWRGEDFWKHLKITEYQSTFQFLKKMLKRSCKILEAGCGLGRWVVPLADLGFEVYGLEIYQEALNVINKNYKSLNLKLVQGDVLEIPFENDTFDVVISLGVLEHFENRETQNKAIAEHKRVMKDDGIFLVTVPYLNIVRRLLHVPYEKYVYLTLGEKRNNYKFYEYRYKKNEFRKILEDNGFKIKKIIYDDLKAPFNFTFCIDYPFNKFLESKNEHFRLTKFGSILYKFLWFLHPSFISGGIGFLCEKNRNNN